MASADILRAARDRIAGPENWTQHELARNSSGDSVSPKSAAASCWCAYGALQAEGCRSHDKAVNLLRMSAAKIFGSWSIAHINDSRGHGAVILLFDDAIAAAEREAGQ